jgi:hypothetical protein
LHREQKIQKILDVKGHTLIKYNGTAENMEIKCTNDHIYRMLLSHYKRGDMCSHCKEELKIRESIEEYIRLKKNIESENENVLLSKRYKGVRGYYKIICGECKQKHKIQLQRWNNGQRCRESARLYIADCVRLKYDDVAQRIRDRGDELKSIEYVNCNSPLEIQCGKCKEIFVKTLVNYMNSNGCNKCFFISKGEQRIIDFLNKWGIKYEIQKTFDGCKYKRLLKFDIYIESYKIRICIEFDGEQHFRAIDYFGGDIEFEKLKEKDKIKNEYCLNNNIKLLRIEYWNIENIEIILNTVLLNMFITDLYYFQGEEELKKIRENKK